MVRSLKTTSFFPIILILSFFTSFSYSQEKHSGSTPIELADGIGLNRTELIKWAKKVNPDLEFSKSTDFNGFPNYVAVDKYNTIVQVVGDEHEIKLAKWTYTFTPDQELNKKLVMNTAYFAYIFEPKKVPDWLKKNMTIVSKDLTQEFIGEKERIGFNKMIQFVYRPKQKTMTIICSTQ